MSTMEIDDERQKLLKQSGHLLVTGGPGSGKTTISIVKASRLISEKALLPEQKIIFLSFARPTVSRVFQAIQENDDILSPKARKFIQVETYHSFFWSILKTHAYLIGYPRELTVLPTPEEAIELSEIRSRHPSRGKTEAEKHIIKRALNVELKDERERLAREEGRICFDQFIKITRAILSQSPKIRNLISDAYPIIILDEFQDTTAPQWAIIKSLGEISNLIALADPEQRIYGFLGADADRLDHFRTTFNPTEFSFAGDNYRSSGTDIAQFGDDLLNGSHVGKVYNDVHFRFYPMNENQAFQTLKLATIQARKRLLDANVKEWSVAVLVPTKALMKKVSLMFSGKEVMNYSLEHTNAIDKEGPILSSYVVSCLMQLNGIEESVISEVLVLLSDYFRGRGGEKVTIGDLASSAKVLACRDEILLAKRTGKSLRKNSVSQKLLTCIEDTQKLLLTGDPSVDWLTVREVLEVSRGNLFTEVARSVKELQLLKRGADLRGMLSEDWLRNDSYENALEIVKASFVREHFSKGAKPEIGVVVMNMHKAKGKQFDEVIIFETWYRSHQGEVVNYGSRIQRPGSTGPEIEQAKYNLRVSVTRAKKRTTIMSPIDQPCELLS